jgi:tetratricopeptide (TPR) repeat protein
MEESPDTKAQPGSHGDVEEWCRKRLDVEPDAMWHVQMAMVLRELDQTSEAEKRCKRALDLDKGNWRASLLLAKLVESHTEAIIILEGLTRRFEDDPTLKRDYEKSLSDIAYNLGIRYWALEKFGKAIDSYTESVQLDPSNPSHVLVILSKYDAARKWGEVISLLEKIQSMEKGHLTALVAAMAENPTFHMIILRAMSNANNFDMLDETYGSAISHTKGREYAKSFYLRVFYASALSAYSPATVERVRVLLEDAARDLPYTDLDLPRAFFLVGYRLGTIYLGRAQRAKTENKPELAQEWLQRLVDIVPEQINEDQMRLPLSLFAARYHHVHGDEESALDLVHNTLGMAIELLSDDDASNDKLAFRKILYAVIPFGDVRNAQAALAMLKRAGRFEIPCSCGCGHTWTTPGDMWWCMDCINLVLTTKCMEKVKNPDLANNICDESHTHFHIPEWDAEKMNVSKKHVPYKGKAITMTHWRNKLTQKYRLAGSGTMHNILH